MLPPIEFLKSQGVLTLISKGDYFPEGTNTVLVSLRWAVSLGRKKRLNLLLVNLLFQGRIFNALVEARATSVIFIFSCDLTFHGKRGIIHKNDPYSEDRVVREHRDFNTNILTLFFLRRLQ